MTTLIATPDSCIEQGRDLFDALRDNSSTLRGVRVACLDEAFGQLAEADTVVVVHDEPCDLLMDFIGRSQELASTVPMIIWGAPRSPEVVVEYLLCGAKACFLDGDDPDGLLEAFPIVQNGSYYLPPIVQRMLLGRFVEISKQIITGPQGMYQDPDGLTEREREVLELLVDGHTNPEIAERLFLEVGTVKNHVHHILTKLDVPDRQSAARYYKTRLRFTPS